MINRDDGRDVFGGKRVSGFVGTGAVKRRGERNKNKRKKVFSRL